MILMMRKYDGTSHEEDVNDDGVNDVNERIDDERYELIAKSKLRGRVRIPCWRERGHVWRGGMFGVDYCGVHLAESDAVNEWISRAIRVPGRKLLMD